MAKYLEFHCPDCGQPHTYIVEELSGVNASRYIDFTDDGNFETEEIEVTVPDPKAVHVHYKCSECGATVLEGDDLNKMRLALYKKLKGEQ